MITTNLKLGLEAVAVKATEGEQDKQGMSRAYSAPELHVVGKAGELVQGYGGGPYKDFRFCRS